SKQGLRQLEVLEVCQRSNVFHGYIFERAILKPQVLKPPQPLEVFRTVAMNGPAIVENEELQAGQVFQHLEVSIAQVPGCAIVTDVDSRSEKVGAPNCRQRRQGCNVRF